MVWYKVGAADETPGKSGLAHFLEHLMFKGTAKNPTGTFLASRRRHRRPGKRLHLQRLHRLLPARAERAAQVDDGIRGRPHDRPAAHRQGGAAGARRHPGGAEPAHRQQSARALRRADRRRAVPQSPLRQAGDRLAPRDGRAHPRRRHRLLPALVRAQRRRGGGRRRRRAGRGAQARRGDLRQGCPDTQYGRASVRRSRRRRPCAR